MAKQGILNWIVAGLFGHQVGSSDAERQSPTYRYQQRQNKLVGMNRLINYGILTLIVWQAAEHNLAVGIAITFILLRATILGAAAAVSDAVFDSLFERINLQSEWLRTRLDALELELAERGHTRGQENWRRRVEDNVAYEALNDTCYWSFPERP